MDARNNWWGNPGTLSVAAGRIRDQEDYSFLIPVDYDPVLQSNASLLDGDCPPGWFHAGQEEPQRFKSCFLFVGGAMPYHQAAQFCKDNDAIMPYFRDGDPRLRPMSTKLRDFANRFRTDEERYFSVDRTPRDIFIWVSGVMIPPEQCGYMSASSGAISLYNCELMLPFVCEHGPVSLRDWYIFRPGGIAAVVLGALL